MVWNPNGWEDIAPFEQPPTPNQDPQVKPKAPSYNPNNFQPGVINPGSRLDKVWWDHASQEERDAAGVGTWDLAKQRMQEWRSRFQEGGDIYEKRYDIGAELAGSGAQSWDDVAKLLARRGIRNEKESGKSWWNELKLGWEGGGRGGSHYNPQTGQWTDVATSNLAVRGVPGAGQNLGRPQSGMAGMLANAGAGADAVAGFMRSAESGETFLEGRTDWGGYYNRRPDGSTDYFDRFGFKTDASGNRIGGHADTRVGAAGGVGASSSGGLTPFDRGAGGGGGGGNGASGGGGSLESQVVKGIKKALQGGSMTPEAVELMKVQAKQRAEGMRQQTAERVNSDLARRGLANSPVGASLQAEASRASDAQYAADATKIEIEATVRAHQEKMQALQMAMQQLNDEANRLAQREGLAIEKARLALQQRQLGDQMQMLQMQLDARLRELGISNQFALDMWERNLPLNIYDRYNQSLGGM